jgi:hypothetical protein
LHRMIITAVSMPISLTSPVAFRANSFFSDIFLQYVLAGGCVFNIIQPRMVLYHIRNGFRMY